MVIMAMYSDYLRDTRTKQLSSILEEKAPGRLSEEERIQIAQFFLDKKILCKDITIRICTKPSDFAEMVTLDDQKLGHSWAGDKIYLDKGEWLVGNGQFGLKRWQQYSENGNCSIPKEQEVDPEFDMSKIQVACKKRYYLNSFRSPSEEWTRHELLIFLP